MIRRRNFNLMSALAIIVLVAIAACGPKGPDPTPAPPQGGNFTEATTADAVSFHPYLTTDTASSSYQGMVYASGLMRRDPETLDLIPNMAQEPLPCAMT
jgi:predicted small lipoprotein YifL